MELIDVVGWLGNMIFAVSAIPQAYTCYRQGHGRGLAPGLLWMWFSGELLAMIYGFAKGLPIPIMANYAFNFTCLVIILRYKYMPRNGEKNEQRDLKNN